MLLSPFQRPGAGAPTLITRLLLARSATLVDVKLSGGGQGTHDVTLLTRAGCRACGVANAQLERLSAELGFQYSAIDVDAEAENDPELRAEYGDRLPVVLLDGEEHSYWEVDEPRLRSDLSK
jgi:glutaredoxin